MLYITGVIGKDTTAEGVRRWLAANGGKPFTVFFDSPGGDADVAFEIDEMLSKEPVIKTEVKFAASAASYIMAGIKERQLAAGVPEGEDVVMIHYPRITKLPNDDAEADDLRRYADQLDKYSEKFAQRYSEGLGISKEAAHAMMSKEVWLKPSAAKQLKILAFQTKTTDEMSDKSTLDQIRELLGMKPKATVVAETTPAATASVDEGEVEMTMDELKALLDQERQDKEKVMAERDQYMAKCAEYEANAKAESSAMEEVLAEVKALKEKTSKLEVAAKANPKPANVVASQAPAKPYDQLSPAERAQLSINSKNDR